MKILSVLSKSFLVGASFLNNLQNGQTDAQKINPPEAARDISEDNYKSVFSIKSTQIGQANGKWEITETIKYNGEKLLAVYPRDIEINYGDKEQYVSNSKIIPHTIPRISYSKFNLGETNSLPITVIANTNDRQRCKEKITVSFLVVDKFKTGLNKFSTPVYRPLDRLEELSLNPGNTFQVAYTIDHEHFLYGTYDPLLGERKFIIRLGDHKIHSTFDLSSEVNPVIVTPKLNKPPEERMDTRQFRSAPDSLYIAADIPGYQYFRFDDMPVRYSDTFKLSFWYLIAIGTGGNCHVRIMEYQDTPNAWYRLEGGFDKELHLESFSQDSINNLLTSKKNDKEKEAKQVEEKLKIQGKWQKIETIFKLQNETTTMALDFRIVGANVGEMWIDDINLENLSIEKEPTRRVYPSSSLSLQEPISQKVTLAK